MKRFVLSVGALSLGLLLVGLVRAEAPAGGEREGLSAAAKKAKGKHTLVQGHKKLSRQKAKSIRNGKHLVHTTKNGHQAHAIIKNGKVAGLRAQDKRGKQLAVKVHNKQSGMKRPQGSGRVHRASAGADDLNDAEVIPAQLGAVFIVFSFVNPVTGTPVFIFFPVNMVAPELGGDPDNGDPDETEI